MEEKIPHSPAPPSPGLVTEPEPSRRFPVARVMLGLVLVAGAITVVFWPRGQELDISWRLTTDEIGSEGNTGDIEAVPAGGTALLRVGIKPGPQAPEGAQLLCGAQVRPRILIKAPEGIAFDRVRGFAHEVDEEIPMRFRVEKSVRPGAYALDLYVEAELIVEGRPVVRAATLRRTIVIKVSSPIFPEKPAEK